MQAYVLYNGTSVEALAYCTNPPPGWVLASSVSDSALLAYYQANLPQTFATAYQQSLLGGFSSSALGSAHNYQSDLQSQISLALAGLAAVRAVQQGTSQTQAYSANILCQSGSAAFVLVAHSAAQVSQLFADFFAFQASKQAELYSLYSQLAACTTSAQATALSFS